MKKVNHSQINFENCLLIFIYLAKKLSRGISRTAENALVISQIRNELSASLAEVEESTSVASSVSNIGQQQQIASLETNDCTFTLPDLSNQSGI